MGWLVLVAIKPLIGALDGWTLSWLLAGGVFYTLGTVFYHRPSLPYSHAIWHMFVLAGSICHYISVMAQVIRARGSVACTAAQTCWSRSPWARRPSRSKSRRMNWRSAAAAVPLMW